MAKIKARQSKFFSGTANSAKKIVKKITGKLDEDEMLCSVSREVLGDNKTYCQFADYHRSNVDCQLTKVKKFPNLSIT